MAVPCDELLITLQFHGWAPSGIDLRVTDPNEDESVPEQKLWRRWSSYWPGGSIGKAQTATRFAVPQAAVAVREPLPFHRYCLTWQVPEKEPVPNLASLKHVRQQLLSLRDAQLAEAEEFLHKCIGETRRQIKERNRQRMQMMQR